MAQRVLLEAAGALEGGATHLALVGILACVDAEVHVERRAVAEGFLA